MYISESVRVCCEHFLSIFGGCFNLYFFAGRLYNVIPNDRVTRYRIYVYIRGYISHIYTIKCLLAGRSGALESSMCIVIMLGNCGDLFTGASATRMAKRNCTVEHAMQSLSAHAGVQTALWKPIFLSVESRNGFVKLEFTMYCKFTTYFYRFSINWK